MKSHLALIFFIVSALYGEPLFLAPDESDHALHHLKQGIASAENEVIVITPKLQNRTLAKSLQKAAQKSVPITLVTGGLPGDDAAGLVRFAGIDYRIVKGLRHEEKQGILTLSLLLVDDRLACLSTLPFARDALKQDIGVVECRTDPDTVARYRLLTQPILERSVSYLNP